jgi:hypothetical protein
MSVHAAEGTTSSRRLRRFLIHGSLLKQILEMGEDVVLVNARYSWPNCVELVVYSPNLEEIPEGKEIPQSRAIGVGSGIKADLCGEFKTLRTRSE